MRARKVVLNKDIVQLTQTSIKGRNSIDAEMNAESFKYGYLTQTEISFFFWYTRILAFHTVW